MTKEEKTLFLFSQTTQYFATVTNVLPTAYIEGKAIERDFDALYAWLEKKLDEKLSS
ncbi:hypothetical protein K9650_002092 [Escherichia coli]|uniref:hypothetical protein n=1 Tax=Citrobacter farmeri TaxID=67824 RepID=UPI0028913214|nr:hypothetical protein [Citrobacter farmeri]EIC1048042.1 hypothetical protein [Escherichia coli]HCO1309870.1 hypothetical protein [Escherichia coli]HDX8039707.1 hypothetical protein [Escherichia coli]